MTPDALDRLRKLAEQARTWSGAVVHDVHAANDFHAACSPDVILSLLDALDAREADAKDAARYRWLRDGGIDDMPVHIMAPEQWDGWIDAALRGGK